MNVTLVTRRSRDIDVALDRASNINKSDYRTLCIVAYGVIPLSGKSSHQKLVAERGFTTLSRTLSRKNNNKKKKKKTVKRATSDQGIGSDGRRKCTDRTGTAIEYLEMETTLKRDKAQAKSNFTRARNKLPSL